MLIFLLYVKFVTKYIFKVTQALEKTTIPSKKTYFTKFMIMSHQKYNTRRTDGTAMTIWRVTHCRTK